ncbi:MAG: hypothetical protein R2752_17850 [Vicinamibacterales bacterium]
MSRRSCRLVAFVASLLVVGTAVPALADPPPPPQRSTDRPLHVWFLDGALLIDLATGDPPCCSQISTGFDRTFRTVFGAHIAVATYLSPRATAQFEYERTGTQKTESIASPYSFAVNDFVWVTHRASREYFGGALAFRPTHAIGAATFGYLIGLGVERSRHRHTVEPIDPEEPPYSDRSSISGFGTTLTLGVEMQVPLGRSVSAVTGLRTQVGWGDGRVRVRPEFGLRWVPGRRP